MEERRRRNAPSPFYFLLWRFRFPECFRYFWGVARLPQAITVPVLLGAARTYT
jgi:hypothetical protein